MNPGLIEKDVIVHSHLNSIANHKEKKINVDQSVSFVILPQIPLITLTRQIIYLIASTMSLLNSFSSKILRL
jgi:hypothetical protein